MSESRLMLIALSGEALMRVKCAEVSCFRRTRSWEQVVVTRGNCELLQHTISQRTFRSEILTPITGSPFEQ